MKDLVSSNSRKILTNLGVDASKPMHRQKRASKVSDGSSQHSVDEGERALHRLLNPAEETLTGGVHKLNQSISQLIGPSMG